MTVLRCQVFVATGEVIRIALETGQLIAERLRCVIFDEVRGLHSRLGCEHCCWTCC